MFIIQATSLTHLLEPRLKITFLKAHLRTFLLNEFGAFPLKEIQRETTEMDAEVLRHPLEIWPMFSHDLRRQAG